MSRDVMGTVPLSVVKVAARDCAWSGCDVFALSGASTGAGAGAGSGSGSNRGSPGDVEVDVLPLLSGMHVGFSGDDRLGERIGRFGSRGLSTLQLELLSCSRETCKAMKVSPASTRSPIRSALAKVLSPRFKTMRRVSLLCICA